MSSTALKTEIKDLEDQPIPLNNKSEERRRNRFDLLKFDIEYISNNWEDLKDAINFSLPKVGKEFEDVRLDRIFNQLIDRKLECWGVFNEDEPIMILVFQFLYENVYRLKNLQLYSMYAYKQLKLGEWAEILKKVKDLSKKLNCNSIIIYSKDEKVVRLCKLLGANTEQTFVIF